MVLRARPEDNLILTGYTGPTQPAIGRQIAERLQMPFINIDDEIVARAEVSLDEIRLRFGEARLKMLETEIIQDTLLRRGTVIRISGHTLIQADHFERLAATGTIICLTVTLGAALQRLHLTMGARFHDPNERAVALGRVRAEWAVRNLPNIHELDTTHMAEDEIAAAAIAFWQQLA